MKRVLPLFRRALLDGWRGLLGWSAGIVAVLAIYLPVYSSLAANGQFEDMIASLPPELVNTLGYDQIATGAGYVQATFFGLVGFVMISIAAVGWGTGAIANDEETGQLELTLAHGVTRGQLYAERTAAVAVKLAWLGLVAVVMVLALDGPSDLGIEVGPLFAAAGAFVGLGLLAASAAIAVGGISGRRSWSLGAGAAVAVYGYTVNALGNQTEDLRWLHDYSPFSWAYGADPVTDGWDWRIWLVCPPAARSRRCRPQRRPTRAAAP